MKNICLIRQPAGIGDIFFSQKIALHFKNLYKVIWPVKENLLWIKDYIINDGVEFISEKEPVSLVKNDICINLQEANAYFPDMPLMAAKYKYAHVDMTDWADDFNFKRNLEKENKLYKEVLGLQEGEPYIFKNVFYGTPPNSKSLDIPTPKGIKVVSTEILPITDKLPEYNVIDWCKVLENAEEIHLVDTCYNYIMEKINLKAKKINLYSRFQNGDFSHIKGLFKVKYNYMGA